VEQWENGRIPYVLDSDFGNGTLNSVAVVDSNRQDFLTPDLRPQMRSRE